MLEINQIYCMDCLDGLRQLPDHIADLIVTSPPYADQRKNAYESISEIDYPQWTVNWMHEVKRILKPTGSVIINIRPNLRNGEISDYVLKMRLALRGEGWKECEELIWIKPDSPPMGSVLRPRRAWESLLWFSQSKNPYCNTKSEGKLSDRIGFENNKFEHGGTSHIHAGQRNATKGIARNKDYIEVGTSQVDKSKGNFHPAQYPEELCDWLIKMLSPENGLVIDPFIGSGTTATSCVKNGRRFVGFDNKREYVEIAEKRLQNLQ